MSRTSPRLRRASSAPPGPIDRHSPTQGAHSSVVVPVDRHPGVLERPATVDEHAAGLSISAQAAAEVVDGHRRPSRWGCGFRRGGRISNSSSRRVSPTPHLVRSRSPASRFAGRDRRHCDVRAMIRPTPPAGDHLNDCLVVGRRGRLNRVTTRGTHAERGRQSPHAAGRTRTTDDARESAEHDSDPLSADRPLRDDRIAPPIPAPARDDEPAT